MMKQQQQQKIFHLLSTPINKAIQLTFPKFKFQLQFNSRHNFTYNIHNITVKLIFKFETE